MEKLQSLQHSYAELTDREMKLSQAKLELSRERMRLQQLTKQLYEKRCSLCKLSEQRMDIPDMLSATHEMNVTPMHSESRMPTVDELLNADAQSIIDKLTLKLNQLPIQNQWPVAETVLDPDLLMVKLHVSNPTNDTSIQNSFPNIRKSIDSTPQNHQI